MRVLKSIIFFKLPNKYAIINIGLLVCGLGLSSCYKRSGSSTFSATVGGRNDGFIPTYQLCNPNTVATFKRKNAIESTVSGSLATDSQVKVIFDPKALEGGVIKCTIKDCTITSLKPVAVSKDIPLTLASIAVNFTFEGQKQVDLPSEKKITSQIQVNPLDVGLARVGVFFATDYSDYRKPDQAIDLGDRMEFEKRFNCKLGLSCSFPTMTVAMGASNKGLFYDVRGNTAMGTSLEYGMVSADYLRSQGKVNYGEIPRATSTAVTNLFKYVFKNQSTLAKGQHADPVWDEIIAQCQIQYDRKKNCVPSR
jgi:hypothetical protein